jgi:hypothetical protein
MGVDLNSSRSSLVTPPCRGNDEHSLNVTPQHGAGYPIFRLGVFGGSGDDDRISMFIRKDSDGMRTCCKKRIIEVGYDEPDGSGAAHAKGTRSFIRSIIQLRYRLVNLAAHLLGYGSALVQRARNGHQPDTRQPCDILHPGLGRRLHLVSWLSQSGVKQFRKSFQRYSQCEHNEHGTGHQSHGQYKRIADKLVQISLLVVMGILVV